jgi:ABC-type Fe3+ transport system substrate-binding protein
MLVNNAWTRRKFFPAAAAFAGSTLMPDALAAGELEALYRAAKVEGKITLYAGGPIAPYRKDANEFSKVFPGIEFDIVTGFSNQISLRVDAQIAARKMEADVAILQTIQDFERWKRADALTAYPTPGLSAVDRSFKDSDGTSIGVRVLAIVYSYNTDQVRPDRVPKSAIDFLDPWFRGRVISTYPHDDDVTLYLYYTIVSKYGWDYMTRLMSNEPQFVRGHLGVAQGVASGKAVVSFDATAGTTLSLKSNGGKIDLAFPLEDRIPIWENRCAIFRGAPHENAARLFQAWLLSREYQEALAPGFWPTRTDVTPAGGVKPISQYATASQFRQFMLDTDLVSGLRERFASIIGPAKGDPVL